MLKNAIMHRVKVGAGRSRLHVPGIVRGYGVELVMAFPVGPGEAPLPGHGRVGARERGQSGGVSRRVNLISPCNLLLCGAMLCRKELADR